MKKMVLYIKFMYFYLRGVVGFRTKSYDSAKLSFEKAFLFNQNVTNELLWQYFGQTLLALGQKDEAFFHLANSYKVYEEKKWKVSDEEEYRLAKDTIDALKYLDDNYSLRIENVDYEKSISIERKR